MAPVPWPTAGGPLSVRLPPAVWFTAAAFTLLTTSGAIFGWVSMASVLTLESVFAEGCPARTPQGGACAAQQLQLNAVYTAASIFAYAAPVPLGAFLDARGPRATLLLCLAIFTTGVALILAAALSGAHALYFAGFVGLGAASSASITPLYSTANLFPGREGLLLALLNGCFDAGALVFQTMAALHASGVPLATVWGAYAGGPLAVSWLLALLLWRRERFPMAEGGVTASADASDAKQQASAVPQAAAAVAGLPVTASCSARGGDSRVVVCPSPRLDAATRARTAVGDTRCGTHVGAAPPSTQLLPPPHPVVPHFSAPHPRIPSSPEGERGVGGAAEAAAPAPATAASVPPPPPLRPHPFLLEAGVDVARLHALPFASQLRTPEFFIFAAAFAVWMLRFNVYLGSVHPQLDALGQSPAGEYTRLFGTILPLGFLAQFAIGALLDTGGTLAGLWALWALGVLFSALNLWLPLAAQPATFVALACFRGFLFTNMASYCARVFGPITLGRTIGSLVLLGGLVSLLQLALLPWAYSSAASASSGGGATNTPSPPDFSRVNGLLLALCAATVTLPLWLAARGASARRAWWRHAGGSGAGPGDAAGCSGAGSGDAGVGAAGDAAEGSADDAEARAV